MSGDNDFIILAAQDLSPPINLVKDCFTDTSLEDDCWTDTQLDTTGDGACPADDPAFAATRPGPSTRQTLFRRPPLHTDRLQDFHLVFNPLGPAGVVLVNLRTRELLETYRRPRPLPPGDLPAAQAARRLAKLRLLEPVSPTQHLRRTRPKTLTVWLHLTGQCNLACDYCYLHKSASKMDISTGEQAVDAVFRSAISHGFERIKLKYAGGEPALNFNTLLHLHDYAQQRADETGLALDGVILSNGIGLSYAMIAAMQARGLRLMISLDGVGQYHDAQRQFTNGAGSFEQVERTLDRLAEQQLTPSISITVSRRNLAGLPKTVAYLLERSLPFTINFYRESSHTALDASLVPEENVLITAMQAAFAAIAAQPPPHSLLGALLDRARLDVLHDRPCGVGDSYMVIDPMGGVAKCQMEIERTITNVAAADPLAAIRAEQTGLRNPPVDEKPGCRTCLWRYHCAGGCPSLSHTNGGQPPNCRVYRTLFPDVIQLEGQRLLHYQ